MKRARTSAHALALSLRPLIARAGIIFLLLASLGIILMGRTQGPVMQNMRAVISDTVTPVISIISKPVDAIASAGHWIAEMTTLREENMQLKADNSRLRQWQEAAKQLASENDKLKALLNFAPAFKQTFISARVAADTQSPYSRSVIITSGANQNVEEDFAVVNESGIVGRVVDVSKKTSRVLLLTDINSRIPVILEDSREHAIAAGNNSDMLTLVYLPENSKVKVGERIVTSGDGNVLPPGIPVGVVTKIEKGIATVKPFVDIYRLEYVSVVDYPM